MCQGNVYTCQYCSYASNRKNNVARHERLHTGDKPFACTLCDFRTTQKSNLVIHERTHNGERPFQCRYCDYRAVQVQCLAALLLVLA